MIFIYFCYTQYVLIASAYLRNVSATVTTKDCGFFLLFFWGQKAVLCSSYEYI